jgi:DNA repair exonuclease SbcCD ATPase subunit
MRLLSLKLSNFQGIKEFELKPNGEDITVKGDNATGKTTLFNAFTWLLFGKDSLGQANFEIKQLSEDGKVIAHGLTHEVEATLLNGLNRKITLRKVFAEKWTKRRGSAEKEFTGHTVDHWIDGVPTKAGEYSAAINQIADEQLFRLLTNPKYFNEQLHWQKRREVLLSVCGDVTDADVIASDPALAELPGILGSRKLDDHRKIILGRRTEINREIEDVPVRISECQKGMIEVSDPDPKRIASRLTFLRTELAAKQQEQARIENGGEIAEKTKVLREIEAKLIDLDNREAKERAHAHAEIEKNLSGLRARITGIEDQIAKGEGVVARKNTLISDRDSTIQSLREHWKEVDGRQFAGSDNCPTCGQPIPQELMLKSSETFNQQKAQKLEEISQKGKAARKEIAESERSKREAEDALVLLRSQVHDLNKQLLATQDIKPEASAENPERIALMEAKVAIEGAIARLKEGSQESLNAVINDITGIAFEIGQQESLIAQIDQNAKAEARIKELKVQERKLASEYERIEKELYLCDLFLRVKVAKLTDRINGKFPTVRFKLFDTLINSGIIEVCETLVNGVPYSSINSAAKIQAGMEICEVLSQHHGVSLPCWVDNRESVIELPKVNCQVISLVVSGEDKQLRVVSKG